MSIPSPWEEFLPPFRLYGKLWHIGGRKSPSYLFDTGDGLLLLDTGFPKNGYFMFQNICDLGYNPHDIRWIDPAGPDPFVDPAEWRIFLSDTEKKFRDFIARESAE